MGKSVRYDGQTDDKAAFTLKALKAINARYPELSTAPRPWFPYDTNRREALGVAIEFLFDEKNKVAAQLPDLDNLAKFILDALQSQYLSGVVWTDDKQVCRLSVCKYATVQDSVNVRIWRLHP